MSPPSPLDPRLDFRPRPFNTARWARGPHLQTLLARSLRSASGPDYERERVETPDGDFLDLDWAPEPAPDAPHCLVLHGLEGNAGRTYVRNLCRELSRRRVRPVAMNFRGCSGEPNRTTRLYHSGATEDPLFILEMLRDRYPDRPLGAMGFSLGGNVLLKLMGERADGGSDLLDVAAVMSVPYDLSAGATVLEEGRMGRLYSQYFLRSLLEKVRLRQDDLSGILDLEAVRRAATIREFDEYATSPLHGFAGAEAYYRESSSTNFLETVRVPTLLLHALDDPFLPEDRVPRDAMEANQWLLPAITERGGHVGFLEGSPTSPRFWGDEEAARFLGHGLMAARSG